MRASGHLQETQRQSMTVTDSLSDRRDTCRRFQTVCDGAKTVRAPTADSQTVAHSARQSPRPSGHLRETPRQFATTVQRKYGHMHETPRKSSKVPDSLPDPSGTCKRLTKSLRRCQDPLCASRRLSDSLRRGQTQKTPRQSATDGA
ncbi:hypothetical protein DPMN_127733 [Dreissena polymorpha]|uniref:Uncharacterized protein n=1 Tax=Dreissena polymorpha TaxID=45954 RepID=A0A9D4GZG8_DREPO|nr:hypothetical protein DPMN_127733 [Dreissena polymorpha]